MEQGRGQKPVTNAAGQSVTLTQTFSDADQKGFFLPPIPTTSFRFENGLLAPFNQTVPTHPTPTPSLHRHYSPHSQRQRTGRDDHHCACMGQVCRINGTYLNQDIRKLDAFAVQAEYQDARTGKTITTQPRTIYSFKTKSGVQLKISQPTYSQVIPSRTRSFDVLTPNQF